MKQFLVLVALAGVLVFSASPSLALWDQYLPGEAGIIAPVDREEGDIHNYDAEGALASEDITFVEAGILGPVDRSNEEVLLANCDNPFEGFMGEAGTLQPVDRESC